MGRAYIILFVLITAFCLDMSLNASCSKHVASSNNLDFSLAQNDDSTLISRTIDASNTFRTFPDLTGYRNTSVQKAPAPILGKLSEDTFGRPKTTRCWLNLDEMWDYRTRQFNFNFKIGVDKYKEIKEKHRETWGGVVEAPSTFYEYLQAFSNHSDAIMLTIRRYERDVLDGKLPITKEDWKMVFKTGLRHYKELFPNIRFVEVGNEYELSAFMNATDEEYYQIYTLGYEAVNEVNNELKLSGNNRILVGGPVVTVDILKKIEHFLQFYSSDTNTGKRLDFVSWHDYHKQISETAGREEVIKALLVKYNLPDNLPMFITEHDPFHFSEDKPEYHYLNAAYLPKSLYFGSLTSPNVKFFPWVLYHRSEIQTKFMWFEGPNDVTTKEEDLKMLPLGCSVKFLSMLKGNEIKVDNTIEGNDLVIATAQKERLVVEAINYSHQRDVLLRVKDISAVFSKLKNRKIHIVKYLIDSRHSNCLANPGYLGGIEKVEDNWVGTRDGQIELKHSKLEKNGIVVWEITK